MFKEKILKKAIDKAVKNVGEFEIWPTLFCTGCQLHADGDIYVEVQLEYNKASDGKRSDNKMWHYVEPEQVIFNHEFAKAFWGEKEVCPKCGRELEDDEEGCNDCEISFDDIYIPDAWKYYLQKMVLEKEPLKYLEKFL